MDKFRQVRTSCQVCREARGERLSFRGAANNESHEIDVQRGLGVERTGAVELREREEASRWKFDFSSASLFRFFSSILLS